MYLFENSQKASRAEQKTLTGRVFETPGVDSLLPVYSNDLVCWIADTF